MKNFVNEENVSPIGMKIKMATKDPIIKAVVIAGGILLVIYLAGFAFKIAAGTIREYKGMNAAIRM